MQNTYLTEYRKNVRGDRTMGELFYTTKQKDAGMSKAEVVKNLKDILFSDDFERTEQQENALIIAIAELLKE